MGLSGQARGVAAKGTEKVNRMAKVPQQSPWLGEAEKAAVCRAFDSNWITEGPVAAEFSRRLRELMGAEYGVFAPNGTLALALGLMALGIGAGDEVIVPDTTFIASATAVLIAGARPVFVDVNSRNFQINVETCIRAVTPRTRAIMPVHLYGMACNMKAVLDFAELYGLAVIEDACEAINVRYRGQHTGTFGDVGCFSFFADKTITTAEGGWVICKDGDIYDRLRYLRNQGRIERGTFIHPQIGYNFRLTDIQAAIGLAQLDRLDEIVARKLERLAWYHDELDRVEGIRFLEVEPGSTYVPFRVVLLCQDAQELEDYLCQHYIEPRRVFYPLHRQPCFQHLNPGGDVQYPNAVYGYEHGICLPVFPTLTQEQVAYICSTIKEFRGHRD